MKRLFLRLVIYVCTFLVLFGGIGGLGFFRSTGAFYEAPRQEPLPSLQGVKKPEYNPNNLRLLYCWEMKPRMAPIL
ncbi:hypothetical protein [Ammoniphilus sp. YIM 78166]|uniref:hypothetical protein n=1 Tax=Ammoniphilus sp. YIM 78166 TaxID=1644106 RepID=UPI001F0DD182|nr:hypothetical protein [Ammoniphilus sp. YIM 78166]